MFIVSFYALCAFCAVLYVYTRAKLSTSDDPNFKTFQRNYLLVYCLAVAGDWLQGPHVYALYESYGMTKHQIEILFIAGFGSSMMFGTFVGSVADKYGRRTNCFVYGVLYGLACITKHFADFWILMVGRLLGGIATSILFSAFESWLVYEHNHRGFGEDLLGTVFSHATLGNSLVAIMAGLVAQFAADMFGFVAPFDLALIILIIMNVLLVVSWTENYGDAKAAVSKSFVEGWKAIRSDRKILCLGLIQSLFEGSMYVFVLEWTPALSNAVAADKSTSAGTNDDGHRGVIPHGYVFASFMVAIMIGSSLFKVLSKWTRVESFMRVVLVVAAVTLYLPVLFAQHQVIIFAGFIVFEICVGLFWPSLGFMRSIYVPEAARATIMNFFRVPLNMIVVCILLQNLPMHAIFTCCVGFLSLAALCQQWLYRNIPEFAQSIHDVSTMCMVRFWAVVCRLRFFVGSLTLYWEAYHLAKLGRRGRILGDGHNLGWKCGDNKTMAQFRLSSAVNYRGGGGGAIIAEKVPPSAEDDKMLLAGTRSQTSETHEDTQSAKLSEDV